MCGCNSTFNRTSLELKLCCQGFRHFHFYTFNRTSLELKLHLPQPMQMKPTPFNRTSLELKLTNLLLASGGHFSF